MNTTNTDGGNRSLFKILSILGIFALIFLGFLICKFVFPKSEPPIVNNDHPCTWNPEEFYTLPAIQAEWEVAKCRIANCDNDLDTDCFAACRGSIESQKVYQGFQDRHKDIAFVFAKNCRQKNLSPCIMVLSFPWFAQFVWHIIIGDHSEDCGMNNCYQHVTMPILSPSQFRLVADESITSAILTKPDQSVISGSIVSASFEGKTYYAVEFNDVPNQTSLLLNINSMQAIKLYLK